MAMKGRRKEIREVKEMVVAAAVAGLGAAEAAVPQHQARHRWGESVRFRSRWKGWWPPQQLLQQYRFHNPPPPRDEPVEAPVDMEGVERDVFLRCATRRSLARPPHPRH